MTTELVSVRIAFHPDDGSEQVTLTREFLVCGRSHEEVMQLFREFCDHVQEGYVVESAAQMGIGFENPALDEGEKGGGR